MSTRWLRCKNCGHSEICPVNCETETCDYCAKGMKLSEVIEILQKSIDEHGDLPIKTRFNSYTNFYDATNLKVERVEQKNNPYFNLNFK